MKKIIYSIIGFIFVCALGVILHFLYGWTDSSFIALFSAVNESTFEHMKLIFFPLLIYAVIQYLIIGKDFENFWCIKLKSILLGLILIPVLFYTVGGIFGETSGAVNILIFFVSAAATFIYEAREFKKSQKPCIYTITTLVILSLIAISFFVFTFYPPEIPLFLDPISGKYGIYIQ